MSRCLYCNKEVKPLIATNPTTFYVRATKVEYEELSAHCPICTREIYIPEVNDQNCMNRKIAHKKALEEQNV